AVLVSRHEDHPVFDDAFRLFWKSRELIEKLLAMFSPVALDTAEKQKPRAAENRVSQAMFEGHQKNRPVREVPEIEVDARFTFSGNEVLRGKDFAQMDAAEMAEAKKAIAALRLPFDLARTRRFKADAQGRRIDPRAMMRSAARTGGALILPKFRSPREVHPPLVVLADISGSMSQYTRIFLHFLHALTEKRRRVHAFVFGTRLTNLTRQMRHRDPDEALAECSTAVKDWSGGTRIGDTLAEFNRLWSRRVLGQGAVVLLITDGLERDDVTGLSEEMERLHKSCRRLIWLNPLLRFDGFEARARGVKAMLPHVDEFRAVHNLDALADLCASLDRRPATSVDPRRWIQTGDRRAA
ncbi:VWA domain-containing protein, partial [Mesorhizobium sp. M1E.F.Ca.ET.041.01.1.1]|uniref:vWA domain-containing protein n=1 Tax=Mesorhizobium sp. M1E.F.Ca.ET.041.01.1.1 TaxID=2496759 RepID=UPI000FCBDA67